MIVVLSHRQLCLLSFSLPEGGTKIIGQDGSSVSDGAGRAIPSTPDSFPLDNGTSGGGSNWEGCILPVWPTPGFRNGFSGCVAAEIARQVALKDFCFVATVPKKAIKIAEEIIAAEKAKRDAAAARSQTHRKHARKVRRPVDVLIADYNWVLLEAKRLGVTSDRFWTALNRVLDHHRRCSSDPCMTPMPAPEAPVTSSSPVTEHDKAEEMVASEALPEGALIEKSSLPSPTEPGNCVTDDESKPEATPDVAGKQAVCVEGNASEAPVLSQPVQATVTRPACAAESPEISLSLLPSDADARWQLNAAGTLAVAVDGTLVWVRSLGDDTVLPDLDQLRDVARANAATQVAERVVALSFGSVDRAKKGRLGLLSEFC